MDKLKAMSIFLHVVEQNSFTQAAKILNMPRSTMTEAIKNLENQLNTKLLLRTTRQIKTTNEGEIYYQHCKFILDYINQSDHHFLHAKPKGTLRIEVHGGFAATFILPYLNQFFAQYPEIHILLTESDRYANIINENIDCVIRIGHLNNSDLIVRNLGYIEQITLASPQYLEQFGIPKHPNDLKHHFMVGFYSSAQQKPLPLEFIIQNKLHVFNLPFLLQVNGSTTYSSAAKQGFGIIQAPYYSHRLDLEQLQLNQILQDYPVPPLAISLLYPSKKLISPRQKVFIDWIVELFKKEDHFNHSIKNLHLIR